jgi:hypothetical protein
MLAMTSTLLLGLVTSSPEATIYLFHNCHVEEVTKASNKVEVIANMTIIE